MAHEEGVVYALNKKSSQQAEASSSNRAATTIQMRILIELQVISFLLHNAYESTDDLAQLRQDIAGSIS